MKKSVIFRFDDIHPFMNQKAFDLIMSLSDLCPSSIMLCLIPDNKDKSLILSNLPIPNYWEKLVSLEKKGVIIGLHGLEHKLRISNKSILFVSKQSEYTELAYSVQKKMILKGLSILKSKGLNPKFFAPPAHGFDQNTLKVLKDINFKIISDGFFRNVCIKYDLIWIPVKTWRPSTFFIGSVNTVCIHLNEKNIYSIKNAIFEKLSQKRNIDFQTIIKFKKKYSLLDRITEIIYFILIKVLFLKKKFSKILKDIN